ncbi:hypothetical protein Pcinc_002582 [Petrolisthes cinctipes]|uniref:Uncharacterized protein n=1 Tax=Petrolisthes cinctipes TaxID=88211 RepID=A0AAE1GHX1_PETCI|nr:hypothetical protein Pcinc_002582 [Petrolisthes cinctipes]
MVSSKFRVLSINAEGMSGDKAEIIATFVADIVCVDRVPPKIPGKHLVIPPPPANPTECNISTRKVRNQDQHRPFRRRPRMAPSGDGAPYHHIGVQTPRRTRPLRAISLWVTTEQASLLSGRLLRETSPEDAGKPTYLASTEPAKDPYKEYIQAFNEDPFAEDTLQLEEDLFDSISSERKEHWLEVITNIDLTHSSKKAWITIKKLNSEKGPPESQPSSLTRLDRWRRRESSLQSEALPSPVKALSQGYNLPRRDWEALNRAKVKVGQNQ